MYKETFNKKIKKARVIVAARRHKIFPRRRAKATICETEV